jgi:hypothetical protein
MRREIWRRESPLWLWAALLALLLVAAAAGAIVAVAATDEDNEAAATTTRPTTTGIPVIPTDQTITISPEPTTTAPTTTFGTTTLSTTTGTTTLAGGTTTWPAGRDGFTIVLKSVPVSEGRAQADAAAQQARTNGLPQVGVLSSSNYSSLTPGYYVAFSGIYSSENQATTALPNARSKGFPTAYVREVRD